MKQKYKIGQIVAIPLPDGKFAYGKVFNNFAVGVFEFLSENITYSLDSIIKNNFLFYSAVTDRAITSGIFTVIGEQPFFSVDSAWAPPMAAGIFPEDHSIGMLHITHKGKYLPASPSQAAGMDICVMCQEPELFVDLIVDRLVNRNNQKYRYKP